MDVTLGRCRGILTDGSTLQVGILTLQVGILTDGNTLQVGILSLQVRILTQ